MIDQTYYTELFVLGYVYHYYKLNFGHKVNLSFKFDNNFLYWWHVVTDEKKVRLDNIFLGLFFHFSDIANTIMPSRIHSAPSTVGRVDEDNEEKKV